ncbi:MAG: ATP-binding protein, partial [Planctomycetota bacterium]|nr:ATP-binding protein [Planctomycetota bacterium]
AQWLSDYRAAIETGTWRDATGVELRAKLEAHFGPQHPVMLDCDRLLRFAEFKRGRVSSGESSAST